LEETRGGLGEALVEGLRGDGDVEGIGGGVGEVIEGGGGVVQQGEDEGLGEDGSGELAGALAEAGVAGQRVGGVLEEVVQHRLEFC
jgi:hypothetical protein